MGVIRLKNWKSLRHHHLLEISGIIFPFSEDRLAFAFYSIKSVCCVSFFFLENLIKKIFKFLKLFFLFVATSCYIDITSVFSNIEKVVQHAWCLCSEDVCFKIHYILNLKGKMSCLPNIFHWMWAMIRARSETKMLIPCIQAICYWILQ